jgi:hypothetical protein
MGRNRQLAEFCLKGHCNWYVHPVTGYRKCKTCKYESKVRNFSKHRDSHNEMIYWRVRHLRMEVVLAYGGKCSCCGEWRYEFLNIHHVSNDGASHRREIGHRSDDICRWLKKNNYPNNVKILCHSCNFSIGKYGYCPHEEEVAA